MGATQPPPGVDEAQYNASIDYALQEVKESFRRADAARYVLDAKAATLVGFDFAVLARIPGPTSLGSIGLR